MKRSLWRTVRRGEQLPPHELASKPLDETLRNTSHAMIYFLMRLQNTEGYRVLNGRVLSDLGVTLATVEGCERRGLVTVNWARVPNVAPIRVKVMGTALTERGRALLAAHLLLHEGDNPTSSSYAYHWRTEIG